MPYTIHLEIDTNLTPLQKTSLSNAVTPKTTDPLLSAAFF